MRVGLGATVLARCIRAGRADGIAVYTRELLARLSQESSISLIPFVFGHKLPSSSNRFEHQEVFASYPAPAVFSVATGMDFTGINRLSGKVDIVHASDHLIPKTGRIPLIATLMDAIPLSHPHWSSARFRRFKNCIFKRAADWADQIITISDYSKTQIQMHFNLPPDRISVIPLGVDDRWFKPLAIEERVAVSMRLDLPERYFLFVGTLQPRKNLERIISAYLTLPAGLKRQFSLLIAGRSGWRCEHLTAALGAGAYGASVRWLSHLSDEDLVVVMKHATALVLPSLYEGFGLPVLEAFASQVPVITSNTTALPEVAGDAAILVNPLDTDEIAYSMQLLAENPEIARTLKTKGRRRAKEYTWDRTVKMTISLYRQLNCEIPNDRISPVLIHPHLK